ncbi:MAG: serine hydrolase, partial [Bacteroidota bacterium]
VWNEGYGEANIDADVPVGKQTRFLMTPAADPIVAVSVMQLIDSNRLELDANINQYLPFDVKHPDFPTAVITLRMLLSHTSGLADDPLLLTNLYEAGDADLQLRNFLPAYFTPKGDLYDPGHYTADRPGKTYQYARMNIALAGYLVEAITGIEFDLFTKLNLFSQLGYASVSWFLSDLDPGRVAIPYIKQGSSLEAIDSYGVPFYPSGQLRITTEYLSRFCQALLTSGRFGDQQILSSGLIEEMRQEYSAFVAPGQALGWRVDTLYGKPVLGMYGEDLGASGSMYLDRPNNTAVILMSNGAGYRQALDTLNFEILQTAKKL